MTKLYLVRHGETVANQQGVYYGRRDVPLTEQGVVQSHQLADKLANILFDRVIISGLQRTKQTADIIVSDNQITIENETIAAFDELDFGDWEGCHYQDLIKDDHQRYSAWCTDWIHQAPPNGESFSQFKARITLALQPLLASQPQGTILLVGHQGVLRVIMLLLLQMPEQGFWNFTFQHGAYSLLNINQGHVVIEKIND